MKVFSQARLTTHKFLAYYILTSIVCIVSWIIKSSSAILSRRVIVISPAICLVVGSSVHIYCLAHFAETIHCYCIIFSGHYNLTYMEPVHHNRVIVTVWHWTLKIWPSPWKSFLNRCLENMHLYNFTIFSGHIKLIWNILNMVLLSPIAGNRGHKN